MNATLLYALAWWAMFLLGYTVYHWPHDDQ